MISNERPSPYGYRPTLPAHPPVQEDTLKHEQLEIGPTRYVFMLKANLRGRFLRITEKTGADFGVLIIPDTGLAVFQQVLGKMFQAASRPPAGKPGVQPTFQTESVQVERKHFEFVLENDPRECFLRIIEKSGSRDNEIIVPIGSLEGFKKLTDEMVEAAGGQPLTPIAVPVPQPDYMLKNGQVQAGIRNFTLQLKQNEHGRFMRIIQEKDGRLSTIIVPADYLEEFKKWVVDIAKAAKKKPAKKKA
jgi:hypothetical protein